MLKKFSHRLFIANCLEIRVNISLYIILAILIYAQIIHGCNIYTKHNIIFTSIIYISVFLHEISHALAMRLLLNPKRVTITLFPLFMTTKTQKEYENIHAGKMMAIALAGPIVNLYIALIAIIIDTFHTTTLEYQPWGWFQIALYNAVIFSINMLPIFPLDGSRILRAFMKLSRINETTIDLASCLTTVPLSSVMTILSFIWQDITGIIVFSALTIINLMWVWEQIMDYIERQRFRKLHKQLQTTLTNDTY